MFKFVVIAMVFAAANAGIIQSGWSSPVVAHVGHSVATSWQNNNQLSVHPVAVKAVQAVHAPIAIAHAPVAVVSSHGGWNNGWNGGVGLNGGSGWNNGGSGWNNGGWNQGW